MEAAQWPQEVRLVKPMEEMASTTWSRPLTERRARPQKEQSLNCPRCNSTNTKFCYYNNYSLTQPRYFCKACRRYWTEGGSLRNVPVGGSRRKKRSSSAAEDLNLAFKKTQDYQRMPEFVPLPTIGNNPNNTTSSSSSSLSAMELLSGISSRDLNSFMPTASQLSNSSAMFPSVFGLHNFKPPHNFSLDGLGAGYGNIQGVQEGGGRLLFPFENLKPIPPINFDQNKGQGDGSGYLNGMSGGGSW